MKFSERKITGFQQMIWSWWKSHRRDLPWRETRDPYRILISEIMLQQTQVSRVLPKYTEFLASFPDVHALASASPASILRVWKGMGYNRRALYLKRTAEEVVRHYNGIFPDTETQLVKLPGLGTYTARALLVFAYEKDVAMVDTNIRQIITHFFYNGRLPRPKDIQDTADQLLPKGKTWAWHQALMDYGATELINIKERPRVVRKSVPFAQSNRFYRGKIVDTLRQKPVNGNDLVHSFADLYKKDPVYIVTVIDGLIKDGLIVRTRRMLHLPE